MSRQGLFRVCLVLAVATGIASCSGKPEDTGQGGGADVATTNTPAPPYPVWANAMIGKPLTQLSRGTATCKGLIDTVTAKHGGAHPGSELEGWAWNEKDAVPMAKVVFTDQAGRIVGAATEGNLRTDVKSSLPEVKTAAVGWKGVAGPVSGTITAVGLTDGGASCTLSSTTL